MKNIIHKIKVYFLKQELKNCGRFFIGGYQRGMVRITGRRFLHDWEVDQVHKWEDEGKIIEDGFQTIISPHGQRYTDQMYSWKK